MKINKTNKFIEVIGHYDNEIECAKMTLLAELYAVEHREGYAKFPIAIEDKLKLVNEKLEFAVVPGGAGEAGQPVDPDRPRPEEPDAPEEPKPSSGYRIYIKSNDGSETLDVITFYGTTPEGVPIPILLGEYWYKDAFVYDEIEYKSGLYYSAGSYFLEFDLSDYEGLTYTMGSTEKISDETIFALGNGQDIIIPDPLADVILYVIPKSTPRITCDLTTLPGWSSVSDGTHTVTVTAKAIGYRDSVASEGVIVTKQGQFESPVIELNGDILSTPMVEDVTKYKVYDNSNYIGYIDSDNNWHEEVSE